MKTLIVSTLYGKFSVINDLFDKHNEVDMCISLGDNYLFSDSTPLHRFVNKGFIPYVKTYMKFIPQTIAFNKPVYAIYGELDDPFVPQDELKFANFFPQWQSVINFTAYNDSRTKSKSVKVGFLSGYYSKRYYKRSNYFRSNRKREKKSLALCKDDFDTFPKTNLDYLFTHEANYHDVTFGCSRINELIHISKPKWHTYGHYNGDLIQEEGYYILDMFENTVVWHDYSGTETEIIL